MASIRSNAIKIITAIICIIGLTSWYLFLTQSAQTKSSIELTTTIQPGSAESSTESISSPQTTDIVNNIDTNLTKPPTAISKLTLLAVVVANPAENSSAVIQFDAISDYYAIGEIIHNTDVMLEKVLTDYVTVTLEGKEYTLPLKGGKADNNKQFTGNFVKANIKPLGAKEKGNRPKQLDQIIAISSENNDYTVAPGTNPALFKAAKFKPGDILKTINDKDVTVPEELAQVNALVATAQTLEFVVLRGGQTVTLYLDIPSKNLSISFN